jgi:hypothetical protein
VLTERTVKRTRSPAVRGSIPKSYAAKTLRAGGDA